MLQYIIIESLGGGLGNLLFQHNIGMAMALKYNVPWCIQQNEPNETDTQRPPFQHYHPLFQHVIFKTGPEIYQLCHGKRVQIYQEPEFRFHEIQIHPSVEIILLKGYFQSYKYFEPYNPIIQKLFLQNIQDLYSSIQKQYQEYCQGKKTVCVHIRRGDYLKLPEFHPVLPESYYKTALTQHQDKRILVFSDDIPIIKDWQLWKDYDTMMIDEMEPLKSIYLMSFCDAFVIANSSMSLNAYYMRTNLDAPLALPNIWFGSKGPAYNLGDLVPLDTTTVIQVSPNNIP